MLHGCEIQAVRPRNEDKGDRKPRDWRDLRRYQQTMHTVCCSLTSTQVTAQEAQTPERDQPSYTCHTEAGTATRTDEAGTQAYGQEYTHTHRLAKVI